MEYRLHNIDDVEEDTCGWLVNHHHYRTWISGVTSSSLLMIRGKPGSGESTAMKRAFNLVRKDAPTGEVTLAFFFNSRGIPMETKLEGLFRSTLHQLFRSHNPANDAFAEWKQKASSIKPG